MNMYMDRRPLVVLTTDRFRASERTLGRDPSRKATTEALRWPQISLTRVGCTNTANMVLG